MSSNPSKPFKGVSSSSKGEGVPTCSSKVGRPSNAIKKHMYAFTAAQNISERRSSLARVGAQEACTGAPQKALVGPVSTGKVEGSDPNLPPLEKFLSVGAPEVCAGAPQRTPKPSESGDSEWETDSEREGVVVPSGSVRAQIQYTEERVRAEVQAMERFLHKKKTAAEAAKVSSTEAYAEELKRRRVEDDSSPEAKKLKGRSPKKSSPVKPLVSELQHDLQDLDVVLHSEGTLSGAEIGVALDVVSDRARSLEEELETLEVGESDEILKLKIEIEDRDMIIDMSQFRQGKLLAELEELKKQNLELKRKNEELRMGNTQLKLENTVLKSQIPRDMTNVQADTITCETCIKKQELSIQRLKLVGDHSFNAYLNVTEEEWGGGRLSFVRPKNM
ncbi:hypothetical protein ABEB36_015621 [Hypothenemus hampei]|uniref:Uncharacterized protein n=1 Tax=Hypothenemus hampei TaxID=57062 RepID=A0ABD1E1U6_HYPHA